MLGRGENIRTGCASIKLNGPVPLGDRFRVVEEPVQPGKRSVTVDAFEDVQEAGDGLVVGRVQSKRPPSLREQRDDGLEVRLECRGELRPRFKEVAWSD